MFDQCDFYCGSTIEKSLNWVGGEIGNQSEENFGQGDYILKLTYGFGGI